MTLREHRIIRKEHRPFRPVSVLPDSGSLYRRAPRGYVAALLNAEKPVRGSQLHCAALPDSGKDHAGFLGFIAALPDDVKPEQGALRRPG